MTYRHCPYSYYSADPYEQGRYDRRVENLQTPYLSETPEAKEWDQGWNDEHDKIVKGMEEE